MRKPILTLTIVLAGGIVEADPLPHSAWYQPSADDTVTCMAIGCREGDYERYPEYAPEPRHGSGAGYPEKEVVEESQPFDPTSEILRRLKDEPMEPVARAEPRRVPETEDAARADFYRALHRARRWCRYPRTGRSRLSTSAAIQALSRGVGRSRPVVRPARIRTHCGSRKEHPLLSRIAGRARWRTAKR